MKKITSSERIKQDKPLEIWKLFQADGSVWIWKVWKFYKAPGKDLSVQRERTKQDVCGRAFCSVQSPYTHGGWDMGDVYYKDIYSYAICVYREDQDDDAIR